MKNISLKKQQKGFTIIEVLIVLAIAGLIMLIVFLAVPALQRNARNSGLQADVSALSSGVSEFQGNNSGKFPTTVAVAADGRSATLSAASASNVVVDLGGNLKTVTIPAAAVADIESGGATPSDVGTVQLRTGRKCADGAGASTATGASPRSYVLVYIAETGGGAARKCQ